MCDVPQRLVHFLHNVLKSITHPYHDIRRQLIQQPVAPQHITPSHMSRSDGIESLFIKMPNSFPFIRKMMPKSFLPFMRKMMPNYHTFEEEIIKKPQFTTNARPLVIKNRKIKRKMKKKPPQDQEQRQTWGLLRLKRQQQEQAVWQASGLECRTWRCSTHLRQTARHRGAWGGGYRGRRGRGWGCWNLRPSVEVQGRCKWCCSSVAYPDSPGLQGLRHKRCQYP